MGILFESLVVAILGLPLGISWIAIPFALVRIAVGKAEASAAKMIAASPPGDVGSLFGAALKVGAVGLVGWIVMMAIIAGGAL